LLDFWKGIRYDEDVLIGKRDFAMVF
jgi:hypothetical protein